MDKEKDKKKKRFDNGPCPFCGRALVNLNFLTKLSDGTEVSRAGW